jgi:prephenate dehydrogenase
MDDPGFLPSARIAIIGLGLMGGSLALALRGRCASLVGTDSKPSARKLAMEMEIVEHVSADPAEVLQESNVVILAAPVQAIIELIGKLPDQHAGRAVVLDLGSTKRKIIGAMDGLPERFDPIGGHPMCGKEKSSLAHAEATLFQGAPFAFTPLDRTSSQARSLADELARAVGAVPLWLDAETHDRWTAATSHLPYLLASALAICTPPEVRPMVGPGFRGTARLSVSSTVMMLDILETNRQNILASLEKYCKQLDILKDLLEREDFAELQVLLADGAACYENIINPMAERGVAWT